MTARILPNVRVCRIDRTFLHKRSSLPRQIARVSPSVQGKLIARIAATLPEEFRRKVLIRRMVWAALPYVLEGGLFLLAAGLIIGGLLTLFCGLR